MINSIRSFFFPTTASLVATLTRTVDKLDKLHAARLSKATAIDEAADAALNEAHNAAYHASRKAEEHRKEARAAVRQADKLRNLLA